MLVTFENQEVLFYLKIDYLTIENMKFGNPCNFEIPNVFDILEF